MRLGLLLLLALLGCQRQVRIGPPQLDVLTATGEGFSMACTPLSPRHTKQYIGQAAKLFAGLSCTIRNTSKDTLALSEAALLEALRAEKVQAVETLSVGLVAELVRQLGPWLTGARVFGETASTGALAEGSGLFTLAVDLSRSIHFAGLLVPHVTRWAEKRATSLQEFNAVKFKGPIGVEAGQVQSVVLWRVR